MSVGVRSAEHARLQELRAGVAAEAAALARPRVWTDTIGALAATAWRGASSFAIDAPLILLSAANAATGVGLGPLRGDSGAISAAQRVARRGGPTYVKLGQFIASADGILPAPWVSAFAWCRDDAPRLPFRTVRSIIDREIGIDALAGLDPAPLAAGSIAQVHGAVLADGSRVVVKVRRPGLRRQLRADIGALALAAAAAERVNEQLVAANLPGFVELFAALALEESDFRLEAENLRDSATAYAACGLDFVTVPAPIDALATERVLVMERVDGMPYDRAGGRQEPPDHGERLLGLAVAGVLKSALMEGIFHGDLHAGNVLMLDDGRFGLIDFGICGRFSPSQRSAMARYLTGFAQADARAQAEALRELGAIPHVSAALAQELERELTQVKRRAHGAVTFEELGATVSRQLSLLSRHGFRMPKELVLFFKSLLYLSSFAATVAPQADLFSAIEAAVGTIGEEHCAQPAHTPGRSAS